MADGVVVIRDSLFIRLPYPNMVIFSRLLCNNFAVSHCLKPRMNDGDGLSIFIVHVRNVVRVMIGVLRLGLGFQG